MAFDYFSFTAMGLGFIIVVIFLYFFIAIMKKALIARKHDVEVAQFYAIAHMFLFFALVRLFLNYNEFHLIEYGAEEIITYKLAAFFGYLFFISFIFVTERIIKKTKYIFTMVCLILCCYGIFFIGTIQALRIYTQVTLPIIALILLVNYLVILVVKTKGDLRRKMGYTLLLMVLAFFFYVIDTVVGEVFFLIPQQATALIARSGLLVTGLLLGNIFVSFETFTEIDWPHKLRDLFILSKGGMKLFHFSFTGGENYEDLDLISAGISGIKALIAEMIKSKDNLRVVDHQDLKLIFEYGDHVILVLLVSENLKIYRSKLATLRTQFENFFQDIFAKWDGDLDIFLPTKQLVKQTFELGEGFKFDKVEIIAPLVRKFVIGAGGCLLIPVLSGFIIYFLNLYLWMPIFTTNSIMYAFIISAISLSIFNPIWYISKAIQKSEHSKYTSKKIFRQLFILLILCAVICVLGLLIYVGFSDILWATVIWSIGIIEYITLMIFGIPLIDRLEQMVEIEQK